ncbi:MULTISPECIES: hypothetical protein [Deefgea]|uniref:Lipoprotein n=1 Tax=Deefgea chitinilytica TaxID=570276 RepID=A0ABS2CAA9_9NEIS|nr:MULTISPECIES: hypothetical protein [Deefgea]MBM5571080.1 hypothetical protein [Deefgea chitinilytica]MBM9888310.1 hypothetical protein [Deefgea sp. CFH1-16]
MWKSLVLGLSLVVAGCASTPAPVVVEQGRLSPPAGQGIAIIALTAQSFNERSAELALHIDGPAGKISEQIALGTDLIRAPSDPNYLNTRRLSFSFRPLGVQVGNTQNVRGRVLVLPLPAGDYMVSNATGSWLREGIQSSNLETVNVAIQQPFHLAAGEVVYLGQVHVNMSLRSVVELSQNLERDFFDLETRRGVTDFSNIIMRPFNAATTVQ